MKSNLIYRPPVPGKKPSQIKILLQIDEARLVMEEGESVFEEIWERCDSALAEWERRMQEDEAEEPVY